MTVFRAVSLTVCAVVAASTLTAVGSVAVSAEEPSTRGGAKTSTPVYARGVIVRTTSGSVSTAAVRQAEIAADIDATATRAGFAGFTSISFDEPVPVGTAREVARALETRRDVVTAEPDVIHTIEKASPVKVNDPYFGVQRNLWDTRKIAKAGKTGGGFSIKAPALWRSTTGVGSVVVAVVDTGVLDQHPDLVGQTVPGWDMISDPVASNDGDGRDADATDPGDHTVNGQCGAGWKALPNSWHGTHVAGIIAAKGNNGRGVVGVAPAVKIQSVRALGPCGGPDSEIALAIAWAAGATDIPGTLPNRTPAKVINLSLGVRAFCSSIMQAAVDFATARGANVVAANGNEGVGQISSPARCDRVTAVHSTDDKGRYARYSNYGKYTDISAPGGSRSTGRSGIISTVGVGATSLTGYGYASYEGTSMASPAVAGGVALLRSLGYSRAQAATALTYAVRKFPTYKRAKGGCTKADCGKGILDLSKVPGPIGTAVVKGTMRRGKKLTAKSKWTGAPKLSYRWYRDGKAIKKATKKTYTIKKSDKGHAISVRVTAKKKHYRTIVRTSARRTVG